MKKSTKSPAPLSRRRFVALMAAGSAALIAPGAGAVATAPAKRRAAGAATLAPVDRKELLRQQAATQATLQVIRGHAMPPGTEMASVFAPIKTRRGNR